MEQVKQSLQETASKERESYKSVFLKKRSVCNRQSVYISGEIQKRIVQIVGVITNKQVSIGNFIDNVLEEHLGAHNDVLSALYREEFYIYFFLLEVDAVKRVFLYPVISQSNTDNLFQVLQMFQCGIVLAMLLCFQPKIKVTDKLPVQFC